MLAKRYMLPGKGDGVIALVASISIGVVMLSVAMLVIVMSVMNGFRAELLDKITGMNGHAIVQAYGGRLDNWEEVLEEVKATPGVVDASPLIEQPLFATYNGRGEGIFLRGNTPQDIAEYNDKVLLGSMDTLVPDENNVAIGVALASNLGLNIGDVITIINPLGRSTPFGTVPRQVGYNVTAIFEIGIHQFDQAYVVMPMPNAQTLLLTGDAIGMIEVTTEDADAVGEIMAPVAEKLAGQAQITDWKTMNSSLFEALQVERVAMFFALSIIVLVAAFNILSSLVMLVRSKTRDIAIMKTMGATRRSLLKIFVTTGSVIGAIGTFAGLALGLLVLTFRQSLVGAIEFVTGASLWDPEVRFLTMLPSKTDPGEVLMIAGMAMGLSFLATLYPSFRAASTDPVEVLRYD